MDQRTFSRSTCRTFSPSTTRTPLVRRARFADEFEVDRLTQNDIRVVTN